MVLPPHIKHELELGEAYRDEYKLELARACAQKVLTIEPENIYAMGLMATTYIYEYEPAKARPFVEGAVRIAPNAPTVRFTLAELLMQEGRYPDALPIVRGLLEEFQRQGRERNGVLDNLLALCYGAIGERGLACHHFEQAILAAQQDQLFRESLQEEYATYLNSADSGLDFFSRFCFPGHA